VLNEDGMFPKRCNQAMVDLEPLEDDKDLHILRMLLANHARLTGSTRAAAILDNWDRMLPLFVKVMPKDYRRALGQLDSEERALAEAKLMPQPA